MPAILAMESGHQYLIVGIVRSYLGDQISFDGVHVIPKKSYNYKLQHTFVS